MILANGQHIFTPAETGKYELEVPFDEKGKITLFGFCDGLQPYKRILPTPDPDFNVPHSDNQLIIKYKKDVSPSALSSVLNAVSASAIESHPESSLQLINLRDISPQNASQKLNEYSEIEFVEPNYKLSIVSVPNDSEFDRQWGLTNDSDTDINMPEAWDIYYSIGEIIVGVIDTGVDYKHEDLEDNIWVNEGEIAGNGIDDDDNGFIDDVKGYNFDANSPYSMDDNGHGTHCAGVIAAVRNNSTGMAGIAPVKIMPLKFLDKNGSGYTWNAINAIYYGVKNGAKILSNSWGGSPYSRSLEEAIIYARDNDVLFIAASGNDGENSDSYPHYPSSYDTDNVVSVASSTESGELSYFSNYGKNSVDLAAPGSNIFSTVPGNRYQSMSGTSMATPHVAGAAALIWTMNPDLSYLEVKNRLLSGVTPVSAFKAIA